MSNETAIASFKEKIDDLNQKAWEVRVTDLPRSFELSEESVKLSRSINYPRGLAEGLRSLGFSYVRFSKNDEAVPLLKESLSLFQSLNDLKGQAVIYEYLGIIERNWGNLAASLDLLLKANEIVLQTGPLEVEITCSYQLGVTYKHLGDHENALDYLYKTLSLAKKINNPLMQAYATNIIGSIYFDNGNYNQALDCYQQGLPIRRQSHDKWGEAGSLDNIGFTYLKLKELDKAIDYCKQSLAISQDTGDKKGEANALLHLGEIYEQAGDVKQAAGFSNESLEIRKARGDKRGETEVLLFLTDLYKNRTDIEDDQIFEWLSGALKIADEIKAQDLLSKAYYNLHEYYQQKGNFKESLVQLEAHFQIEKELHKNSINQKIANLEISHKAEVVSQRNKELTELNEKIEKANEELKIEAALEKVRSRTMAMHKSDELAEAATLVFQQFSSLGLLPESSRVFFSLIDEDTLTSEVWTTKEDGILRPGSHRISLKASKHLTDVYESWKAKKSIYQRDLTGSELTDYLKYIAAIPHFKEDKRLQQLVIAPPDCLIFTEAIFAQGTIGVVGVIPLTGESQNTLIRFSKVFEQTYTRFLDLQKAEAQARESQIQLALERVRARTMAMHNSNELSEVAALLFEQVKHLGVETYTSGFNIWDKEHKNLVSWMSNPTGSFNPPFEMPVHEYEQHSRIYASWKNHESFLEDDLIGEALVKHYKFLRSFPLLDEAFSRSEAAGIKTPGRQVHNNAFFSSGYLLFITPEPCPQYHDIFKRFAKVFEQTYTRFLDLQKAEAQARESQIQLALERVRARTMAMQHSDELKDAASLLFKQLEDLGVKSWSSGFNIWEDDGRSAIINMCNPDGSIATPYHLPHTEEIFFIRIDEARQRGDELLVMETGGKDLEQTYNYMFSLPEVKKMLGGMEDTGFQIPKFQVSHCAFFSQGYLMFITYEPVPEMWQVFKRLAKVFEQTYTRFLDLQKAEAQAREAKIETALEKVRSRTMAMHRSEELAETAEVLFKQLSELGNEPTRISIGLPDEKSGTVNFWITDQSGQQIKTNYKGKLTEPTSISKIFNGWKAGQKSIMIDLQGKEFENWIRYSREEIGAIVKNELLKTRRIHNVAYFSHGWLNMSTNEPISTEAINLLERFASVFNLTYRRFLDLKKAEAQAREAQIEAALERVRSRTMGMQKSEELKDVIQVVYEQFVHLNINIEHTGFVMDYKARDDYDIWIADPLGVPSQVTIPYFDSVYYNRFNEAKEKGEDFFATNLDFEEKNKFYQKLFEYVPGLTEEAKEFYFSCPGLAASTVLLDNVCLYIENFSGTPYTDEENATLMRFGKVFQQTYTRFNDLKLAEAHALQAEEDLIKLQTEKKRAEDALSELQVTQKQLIQSEKMASLGELTAGIAHEIQNPLNFVNNFSDVNKELLVEMKEEIEKGNTEEVIAIANDIISNEEKINHHGKRADAIVKGMLQHSRSNSGVMEPTDINELADEYLRLAYHGLRAKDKSFNATMKTDFDEAIGKVNVIPQEIGRVFLNLITNAFYVVAEKKKQLANGYEPTVTVTTKKENGNVVVSVKDNGNGIPQKVLDKIFQPFFTTKPTGQGTGLGLSLSYDIVKAHSGEIKVKTKDGEGSEFVIQLPVV